MSTFFFTVAQILAAAYVGWRLARYRYRDDWAVSRTARPQPLIGSTDDNRRTVSIPVGRHQALTVTTPLETR